MCKFVISSFQSLQELSRIFGVGLAYNQLHLFVLDETATFTIKIISLHKTEGIKWPFTTFCEGSMQNLWRTALLAWGRLQQMVRVVNCPCQEDSTISCRFADFGQSTLLFEILIGSTDTVVSLYTAWTWLHDIVLCPYLLFEKRYTVYRYYLLVRHSKSEVEISKPRQQSQQIMRFGAMRFGITCEMFYWSWRDCVLYVAHAEIASVKGC